MLAAVSGFEFLFLIQYSKIHGYCMLNY